MLDLSKSITVPILSGTEKRCKVQFPTDPQWCERARKQRVIRDFLGNRQPRRSISAKVRVAEPVSSNTAKMARTCSIVGRLVPFRRSKSPLVSAVRETATGRDDPRLQQ